MHRVEDIMAPLRFVEGLARPSWHLPGTTPTKCAGRRAVTRHRVGWAVIAVALGLLQGDAARAGALTDAKLTLHIWELPAVEFPATVATGVSVSDTEFHVASVTWFYGGSTTVENTATTLYPSGLHLCVYGASTGTFTGATRSTVAGNMRIDGDWGPGFQTVFFPTMILGTSTTVTSRRGWSVAAKGWTVGQAVVSGVTTLTSGGALNTDGTATYTGSNGLTSMGAGTVQLVSPTIFHTSDFFYDPTTVAGFAVLELTYVPEPAALAMLLPGSLLLLILARRKMRTAGPAVAHPAAFSPNPRRRAVLRRADARE